MKHTLLNKYMAGETSVSEEHELRQLLLDMPQDALTEEENAVLRLLSYTRKEDGEDIFSVDYSAEYDEAVRPRHSIGIWYWLAAACVAGVLFLFLMPPEGKSVRHEEGRQLAELRRDSIATKTNPEPVPPPVEELGAEQEPLPVRRIPAERLIAKADVPETAIEEMEIPADIPIADILQEETAPPPAQPEVDEPPQEQHPEPLVVTYPERLKYTPEEMKKLKEIAREKYLEWIQLEQEILNAEMKYLTELIKEQ